MELKEVATLATYLGFKLKRNVMLGQTTYELKREDNNEIVIAKGSLGEVTSYLNKNKT